MFISPSIISASQLATIPLTYQRFHDHAPAIDDLLSQNIVMWVNPKGGGGRGKQIAGLFERDLQGAGFRVHRLDPHQPTAGLEARLSQSTRGNLFILETLPDRTERISNLAQALSVIAREGQGRPIGLPMGGDGTVAEFMEAGLASVGLSTRDFIDHPSEEVRERLQQVPYIAPAKAGSASDYATQARGTKSRIVEFLRRAVSVPVSCAITSLKNGEGTEHPYLTPHSVGFGFGAEIFRRGDRTKYGWFRGSPWNYKLRIPGILADSFWAWMVQRIIRKIPIVNQASFAQGKVEDPAKNFTIRYQIEGQEAITAEVQDVLLTGLSHLGGGLYIPTTPPDGAAMLLTGNVMGALPAAAEVKVRSMVREATGDDGSSVMWGDEIQLMSSDRQIPLRPGTKLHVTFTDQEGQPETAAAQINGEYVAGVEAATVVITPPYPGFLAAPKSKLAQKQDLEMQAARPVVRNGVWTFITVEAAKHLFQGSPALASVAMTLGGLLMSRKAPRAALTGVTLAPVAAASLWGAHMLQDFVDLGEAGLQGVLRNATGSLAVYLGIATAVKYLAKNDSLRKIISGDIGSQNAAGSPSFKKHAPEAFAYLVTLALGLAHFLMVD